MFRAIAVCLLVSGVAYGQLDYATGIGEVKANVPATATYELVVVVKFKGQSSLNLPATGCSQITRILNGTSNGSKVTFTGMSGPTVNIAAPIIGEVCGSGNQTWAKMEIADIRYAIVARHSGKVEFLENTKP